MAYPTIHGENNIKAATITNASIAAAAREAPSGAINGSNTSYTITSTPVTATLQVFHNGLLMTPTTDYGIAGTTITTTSAPVTGDTLYAVYANA